MSSGYRGLDNAPPSPQGNMGGVLAPVITYLQRIREVVNNILQGKVNVTLAVTLQANAASTTITDPRIGGSSAILLCPLTAHAAAELAGGACYVASVGKQNAAIAHANSAQTDRSFTAVIIG